MAMFTERTLVRYLLPNLDQAVTTSVATVSANSLSAVSASANACTYTSNDVLTASAMYLQTCEDVAAPMPSLIALAYEPGVMYVERDAQTKPVTANALTALSVPA